MKIWTSEVGSVSGLYKFAFKIHAFFQTSLVNDNKNLSNYNVRISEYIIWSTRTHLKQLLNLHDCSFKCSVFLKKFPTFSSIFLFSWTVLEIFSIFKDALECSLKKNCCHAISDAHSFLFTNRLAGPRPNWDHFWRKASLARF